LFGQNFSQNNCAAKNLANFINLVRFVKVWQKYGIVKNTAKIWQGYQKVWKMPYPSRIMASLPPKAIFYYPPTLFAISTTLFRQY
jgi:hypothetical protein